MVVLRQQQLLNLLVVDYSLRNSKLLAELCHLLLQKSGTLAVQGCRDPPTQQATLTWACLQMDTNPRGVSMLTLRFIQSILRETGSQGLAMCPGAPA